MSFLHLVRSRRPDSASACPEGSRRSTGDRTHRHKDFDFRPWVEIVEDRILPSTITDLGTLGGNESYAQGINATGQVVGYSATASGYEHAFLYSDGEIMDLGTPPGVGTEAEAINDSDQVVGGAAVEETPEAPGYDFPFLYSGGSLSNLGTLGQDPGTVDLASAQGINDAGQIVGYAQTATSAVHAFLYTNGAFKDLGTLNDNPMNTTSEANGINAAGQVVGFADKEFTFDAFLYTNGTMVDLGNVSGGSDSVANAINASGQVVGYSEVFQGRFPDLHAFLYSKGAMIDLGSLGGNGPVTLSFGYGTDAEAINDSGQVVGYSTTPSGDQVAFLYSKGTMIDLNTVLPSDSGWTLTNATGINDAGQVVGNGFHNGQPRAFELDLEQLAVTVQPPSPVVAGDPFEVDVQVDGPAGSPDPYFNGSVTISVSNNPSGGTLGGTLTVAANRGVADFPDLTLDQPGQGYILQATSDGVVSATTNPFEVADDIVVDSVSTVDARELIVDYDIRSSQLSTSFDIGIYRSSQPEYDTSGNNVEVAAYRVAGADLIEGDHTITIDASDCDWGLNSQTLSDPLVSDPQLPYVLAVADPEDELPANVMTDSSLGFFRIYTIAAVTHGQEFSNDGPTAVPWMGQLVAGLLAEHYDAVVPVYWKTVLPGPGQAQVASDVMYNDIVAMARGLSGLQPNDIINVQLIGHSRGASVIGLAMQELVTNPPDIPQLQHGYYEMTFLDPHPASPETADEVSMASLAALSQVWSPAEYAEIVLDIGYFIASVHANDPSVTVPTRVNQVEDYYQRNSNFSLSVPALMNSVFEAAFNLWGDSGQITIASPTTTLSSSINISSLGVGHGEVPYWYLTNLAVLTNGSPPPNPVPPWPAQDPPGGSSSPIGAAGLDQLLVIPASLEAASGAVTQVYVLAVSSAGNPDASFDGPITLSLQDSNGATLGGILTENAVNGVAEFTDVRVGMQSTGDVLQASGTGVDSGSSPPFNVVTDQLAITTGPPGSASVGSTYPIVVEAEDGAGNLDAGFNGQVTVALSYPFNDSPETTVTLNAVDGTASGTVTITQPGEFIVAATSDGVADAFIPLDAAPVSSLPTPSFSDLSTPVVTYGTASTTISGQLQVNAGGPPIPEGETVQVTLDGVVQNVPLAGDDSFSTSFATATLGVAGSPYTIGLSYAGDANDNGATDSTTLTVEPAMPTVSVIDAGGPYNGTPFPATATVAGVVPGVDNTPEFSLEGVTPSVTYYPGSIASGTPLGGAPTLAGTYTVVANFAGSPDYASSTAQATFTITTASLLIISVEVISPNPRNSAVSTIDVTFSAPINTGSLTPGALTLTDDGGPNLINGGVSVSLVGGTTTTYAINGLAALTKARGLYTLIVNAADIEDRNGNLGTGSVSTSWLMDTTPPTSTVSPLPEVGSSLVFPVTVTGAVPTEPAGSPTVDIASFAVYVSTNGGAWTPWQTLTPSSGTPNTATAIFTGVSNTVYAFYSTATDNVGNTQLYQPTVEASTDLPNLNTPATQVTSSSTYNTNGTFSLNLTGTDSGGSGLAYFEVYAAIDAQAPVLIGPAIPAGVPSSNGTYQATITYQGLDDGTSHTYRFYSIGIDAAGLIQPTPSMPNVTDTNVMFQPPSQLAVTGLTVENGAAERSYIRYLDLDFNESGSQLTAIVNSVNNPTANNPAELMLTQYGLDGSGAGTAVSLKGLLAVIDDAIEIDFGAGGIGGNPSTTAADGYYALAFTPTGSQPGVAATHHFYRLLGDVNGDGTVDQNDLNAIAAARGETLSQIATAINQPASGLTALSMDVNGDGSVNTTDVALATKSKGQKLGTGLSLG